MISDIHANLHALDAVLEDCERRGITQFFCLGDMVSYGAFPAECVKKVRALRGRTVLGNHDECVATGEIHPDLNPLAVAGIEYSIRQLDWQAAAWLRDLPFTDRIGDATLVHGSLCHPERWDYVTNDAEAATSFACQQTVVCFFGHTHTRDLNTMPGNSTPERVSELKFRLRPHARYMVNPGAVGQPRNGIPDAQLLLFDPEELTVEFLQVPYDIDAAEKAIIDAGLPPELGHRLHFGM